MGTVISVTSPGDLIQHVLSVAQALPQSAPVGWCLVDLEHTAAHIADRKYQDAGAALNRAFEHANDIGGEPGDGTLAGDVGAHDRASTDSRLDRPAMTNLNK